MGAAFLMSLEQAAEVRLWRKPAEPRERDEKERADAAAPELTRAAVPIRQVLLILAID
jgi:hypothetical protein